MEKKEYEGEILKKAVIKTVVSKKRKCSKLGKMIKKRLIDKGMTARQLADALGTTPQYLDKIIHGERSGEKYLEAIRAILGSDIAA